MAILRLKSGNPKLSFVIQKNPNSGMLVKPLKQGCLFGYYARREHKNVENEYIIYFKDASDSITYKRHPEEQFEYLNSSKYNDARFINDAIQEVLHSAREGKGDSGLYDQPYNHMVEFSLVETEFKTIDIFRRYIEDIEIRAEEVSKNNYRMRFVSENKMTLRYMLQVINLFGVFAQLNSPTYTYLTEDLVKKYVRIMNDVDAPYFMRYLLKIRMCRGLNIYNQVKEDLVKTSRYKIEMQHGDTHDARKEFIRGLVDPDKSIIDIGAGMDYQYVKMFAPKLQEKGRQYYAIERDLDARERIKAGIRNRNLEDTVEVYESLDEFYKYHDEYLKNEEFNVICTEVLEHNEFADAKSIVSNVSRKINFNNFIITVPNAAFNVYYGLDGFRHSDHKWEANRDDVYKLCDGVKIGYQKVLSDVGDKVDGISVTFGLQIKKVFA